MSSLLRRYRGRSAAVAKGRATVRAEAVRRRKITITAVDEEIATRVCGGRRKASFAALLTDQNEPVPLTAKAEFHIYSQ
jgi:hypothetical protein